jgi:hypothetical protein
MKRKLIITLCILSICSLVGCNKEETTTSEVTTETTEIETIETTTEEVVEETKEIYEYNLRKYDVRADKNAEECNNYVADFFEGKLVDTKTIDGTDYYLDEDTNIYRYAEGWDGSEMDLLALTCEKTNITDFNYMKIENNILFVVDSNGNYYISKIDDISNLETPFTEIAKGKFTLNVSVASVSIAEDETIIMTLIDLDNKKYIDIINKEVEIVEEKDTKKSNKEETEETTEEIVIEKIDDNEYWHLNNKTSLDVSVISQVNTWFLDGDNYLHILNDENVFMELKNIKMKALIGENDNEEDLYCYAIGEDNTIYVLSNTEKVVEEIVDEENIEEETTENVEETDVEEETVEEIPFDIANSTIIIGTIKGIEGEIEFFTTFEDNIIIKTTENCYSVDKDLTISFYKKYNGYDNIIQIYQNRFITDTNLYKILN